MSYGVLFEEDMPPSEMLEIIKYWKREYHMTVSILWAKESAGAFYERSLSFRNKAVFP